MRTRNKRSVGVGMWRGGVGQCWGRSKSLKSLKSIRRVMGWWSPSVGEASRALSSQPLARPLTPTHLIQEIERAPPIRSIERDSHNRCQSIRLFEPAGLCHILWAGGFQRVQGGRSLADADERPAAARRVKKWISVVGRSDWHLDTTKQSSSPLGARSQSIDRSPDPPPASFHTPQYTDA